MCFVFLHEICPKYIFFSFCCQQDLSNYMLVKIYEVYIRTETRLGVYAGTTNCCTTKTKCPLVFSDFTYIRMIRHFSVKLSNMKRHIISASDI
jgi:hypothetical protein